MRDLLLLKRMLLFTLEDEHYLHMAGIVLADQTESILDNWYAQMQAHPYVGKHFPEAGTAAGQDQLEILKPQFRQWLQTLCMPPERQAWLQQTHAMIGGDMSNGQLAGIHEIPVTFLRYLMLFIYPVTHDIVRFLGGKGHTPEDIGKMQQSWFKAVSLSTLLWTWPSEPMS